MSELWRIFWPAVLLTLVLSVAWYFVLRRLLRRAGF